MAKLCPLMIIGACVLAASVVAPGVVSALGGSTNGAATVAIRLAAAAPPAGEGIDKKGSGEAKPTLRRRFGAGRYDENPEFSEAAGKLMGMRHRDEAPKVGEPAPDFELAPIKFYDFKTDDADVTKENAGVLYEPVRLSSFRGKKPVALIFGSYT